MAAMRALTCSAFGSRRGGRVRPSGPCPECSGEPLWHVWHKGRRCAPRVIEPSYRLRYL